MTLGEPAEPLRCHRDDCSFVDGGSCARSSEFSDPRAGCPELVRLENKPDPQLLDLLKNAKLGPWWPDKAGPMPGAPAPWAGDALVPEDIRRLLGRSHPRVIAVVGDTAAGKTSLVTSFFLQLANGHRDGFPYRFASSLSLKGIRDLVHEAARWSGSADAPVLPRTPSSPGARFIHLGLRPAEELDDRHIDVLISDIDGEVMKRHASQASDLTRAVMSFLRRADAVIVVTDAGALMTEEGVSHDRETARVFGRILSDLDGCAVRPCVALVFAKFDRVIKTLEPPPENRRGEPEAWETLRTAARATWRCIEQARRDGFTIAVFPVSAFPKKMSEGQPVNVVAPFAFAMRHADAREVVGLPQHEPASGCSSFDALRRWRK